MNQSNPDLVLPVMPLPPEPPPEFDDLPPKWSAPLTSCVFCDIAARRAPAMWIGDWGSVIAITPLKPVTPGHVLFLPRSHAPDFAGDPRVSAEVMRYAAMYVAEVQMPDVNLIVSKGAHATQTVKHLHIHVVPRSRRDKLALPWDPAGEGADRRA